MVRPREKSRSCQPSRRLLDRRANTLICAATADIAEHRVVDVGVGRMRRLLEQRRGLHDLSGLAIAALRHVQGAPGLLDGMFARWVESLDGDDRLAADIGERRLAGT